jgi:quercetin dioxygenase-like cupin family protein
MRKWTSTEQRLRWISRAPQFQGTVGLEQLGEDTSPLLQGTNVVAFRDGAHTRLHSHPEGQILVVLEGRGFVETEDERVTLAVGDVVVCPPGERHRHGALPGADLIQLTVAPPAAAWLE